MHERSVAIDTAVDYLEQVLGVDWLKDCLRLLKKSGGGGGAFGRAIDYRSCGVAPVGYYWYRAREELALAGMAGAQAAGLFSLYAAVIGDDLLALRGSDGLEEKIHRLKGPGEASGVVRELCVASGYARGGRRVKFTGESGVISVEPGMRVWITGVGPFMGPAPQGDNKRRRPETDGLPGRPPTGVAAVYLHEDAGSPGAPGGSTARPDFAAGGAQAFDEPVIVFSIGASHGDGGPVIARRGHMAAARGRLSAGDFYIPDELIRPARRG
ncbi:MAG: hypothetical protein MJA84_02120 [Firmicutes bacterium]|nr:hypothetical protein [Bacillota bacterium]